MTESEYRKASKAWSQRNSDSTTTGAPLPERVIEEVELPVEGLATQGVRGQVVTWQRHIHIWAVADPDAAPAGLLFGASGEAGRITGEGLWPTDDGDGRDGDGHSALAGTMLDPFTWVNGLGDGDGDGHASGEESPASAPIVTGAPSDASSSGAND